MDLQEDPRFWSWSIVSLTLVMLWMIQTGRWNAIHSRVLTAPDSTFQGNLGASYQSGQSQAPAQAGVGGLDPGSIIGDIFGGLFG